MVPSLENHDQAQSNQHDSKLSQQIEKSSNYQSFFELNPIEFEKFIRAYKLMFSEQFRFNDLFGLNDKLVKSSSKEFLKDFLEKKINEAFANPRKISNYHQQIEFINGESRRGFHGGFHVASVAFLAKNLLKIYQHAQDLFDEKTQQEICEFEDSGKIKDLEILCLMHDVARTNSNFDQDEYKNAFYVALMMRDLGDERFQGDKISEDGLKMIMDLALKEQGLKDKSLTSKLIQSADSLDIVRLKYSGSNNIKFNFDLMNLFQEVNQIEYSNKTKKIIRMIQRIVSENTRIIQHIPEFESLIEPLEMFECCEKIQKLEKLFESELQLLSNEELSANFPTEQIGEHYIHVMKSGADPKAISPSMFICSTYHDGKSTVLSYAERAWHSKPFLILGAKPDDGAVFLTGFKTDIASNRLVNIRGQFRSDIDRIIRVANTNAPISQSYMTRLYPSLTIFDEKWKQVWQRRNGLIEDISDGQYFLRSKNKKEIFGKVGFQKYQGEIYSRPHHDIRTPKGALRHNEVHLYASLHIMDYVGLTVDVFERGIDFKTTNSGTRIEALSKLKVYKNSINYEKNRLKSLKEPLKDRLFKSCVELELSRITSVIEKIYELELMRREILNNPKTNIYWINAIKRKADKFSESGNYIFKPSESNRLIWTDRKIAKIDKELEILRKDLKSFESSDNFGFRNLEDLIDEVSSKKCCSIQTFEKRLSDWKKNILDGKTNLPQLEFAIERVKKGLDKKTKMTLHDVFNPTKLIIISDDELDNHLSKIVANADSKEGLFKSFFDCGDFESIFKTFTKQQVEKIYSDFKQKYLKTQHDTFDEYVIDKKLDKCHKDELESLIKCGLDIYIHKTIDINKKTKQIEEIPFSFHKAFQNNNKAVLEILLKSGVLIISPHKKSFSSSRKLYKSNAEAQNMIDFQEKLSISDDKVLSQLENIISKFDDSQESNKSFQINFEKKGNFFKTTQKSIEINILGIGRIFDEKILPANERSRKIEELFKARVMKIPHERVSKPVASYLLSIESTVSII